MVMVMELKDLLGIFQSEKQVELLKHSIHRDTESIQDICQNFC